jgi:hypothetical protein
LQQKLRLKKLLMLAKLKNLLKLQRLRKLRKKLKKLQKNKRKRRRNQKHHSKLRLQPLTKPRLLLLLTLPLKQIKLSKFKLTRLLLRIKPQMLTRLLKLTKLPQQMQLLPM